jgi:uncharacterized protein
MLRSLGRAVRRAHGAVMRTVTVSAVALMLGGCMSMFVWPDRTQRQSPDQLDLQYRDVWLKAHDGIDIHAWHLVAERPRRGVVLYLHGTTRNNSAYLDHVAWLPAHGFDVLMLDPRGYGQSEGYAELTGLHRDAATALAYVANRACGEIIVFGQSLGGAIAIHSVANTHAKHCVRGVIADSAFASYRSVAMDHLPKSWLAWPLRQSVSLLISERFSPERVADKISPIPLLIVHGDADALVPVHHARMLFEAATDPRHVWIMPRVEHIAAVEDAAAREQLAAWMRSVMARMSDNGPDWSPLPASFARDPVDHAALADR